MRARRQGICLWAVVMLMLALSGLCHAQSDTVTYVYTDPQGTPLAKADASGNIVARYDYTPYGNSVASLGNPPSGPGYTGHVNDPETGLVYMQARYYQPTGRFLSPDPVEPAAGNIYNFNRYAYANGNPNRYTDPDGRNVTEALGGVLVESWNALNGRGFDGASVLGALKDGYNGEGEGRLSAALQDATTISVVAGGVGAIKGAASLAARQTGEQVVSNLAKGAIKDDIKGAIRQIVKDGGEKQFKDDTASAMKGADVKLVQTERGTVQVGTHSDGTTVSARSFSSSDRPTIQVNQPNTSITTKVRYEQEQ